MSDEKDYTAESKDLISRKERELERMKEGLKAFEKELKNLYKTQLKDQDVRSALAQEMVNGVRGRAVGNRQLLEAAQKIGGEGTVYWNEGAPTGFEDKYWENDE